jgi:hypothetical protein
MYKGIKIHRRCEWRENQKDTTFFKKEEVPLSLICVEDADWMVTLEGRE